MSRELLRDKIFSFVYEITYILDLLPTDAFVKVIDDRNAAILIGYLYNDDSMSVVREFAKHGCYYLSLDREKVHFILGEIITPISKEELKEIGYIPFAEFWRNKGGK